MMMLVLATLLGVGQDPWYESYRGKTPPEIEIPDGNWINSDKAVTLESLRGKVVWVEFVGSVF